MFALGLPELGSFSFAPSEILSNMAVGFSQYLCSFRILVQYNPKTVVKK